MKNSHRPIALIFGLICALTNFSTSVAAETPKIESFKFTPTEIDTQSSQTTIDFELTVSHPLGIDNLTTLATVKDRVGSTWSTYLTRIDSPVNRALTKVTFKGSITMPRNVSPGVYSVESSEVRNNSLTGYQFGTGKITASSLRNLIDAENALLIKDGGDLNYVYTTFQGPAYNPTLSISYKDPVKYNAQNQPIWRVGEDFDPNFYYEKLVPSLNLEIKSTTPSVCQTNGKKLLLISRGSCEFTVYTPKDSIFAYFENKQVVEILGSRQKSELFIPTIESQTSKNLPKIINLPQIYGAATGYVLPFSITPTVCVASGFTARLISGGTCTLTYQTPATSAYLASEIYRQSFEISRDPQTITFIPPLNANISMKTLALSATASSGGVITYETSSAGICSITGSTLNLLKVGNCSITATQAGTTTLAPISATATVMIAGSVAPAKKTITCVKGKKTKKVSGTNPKCPRGFKIKR
jgi:hypothetical protein